METTASETRKTHLEAILLWLCCLVMLIPSIWMETSITGQDEYWLSLRTPLEMQAQHDWLTPWLNDSVRLAKPPLLYWCILISQQLFGVSLASARIWGALAGSGLALCSYLLARELFGRHALLAGLITCSSIGIALQGRQAMLDLPVAFFSCLATYFAWRALTEKRLLHALMCGLNLGLGCMVKGPICLYFFAVSIGCAGAVFRKRLFSGFRFFHLAAATICFLAISLPWPMAMHHLHPEFLRVLGGELNSRELGTLNLASPFSALGGALGLIYPWTIVGLSAVVFTFFNKATRNRRIVWLTCWYLASIAPFFFMKAFERYMLAVIPPLAILCACHLENVSSRAKRWLLWSAAILTMVVALFFCLFAWWFKLALLSPLLGLLCLGLVIFSVQKCQPHLSAAAIMLTLTVIIGLLYPKLGINELPQGISTMVTNKPVAVFNSAQPSMLSIRLKRSVKALEPEQSSGPNSLAEYSGLVFVTKEELPFFELLVEKQQKSIKEVGMFRTFYSHQAWQRIAREDATGKDWAKAFKNRSLEDLKSQIFMYQLL